MASTAHGITESCLLADEIFDNIIARFAITSPQPKKYRYQYVLINSSGEKQTVLSPIFDNPYKMAIALLQSYRLIEKRLFGDLALVLRPTADFPLDIIKLRIAISKAREIITRICEYPDFPGQITENLMVFAFTPEPGSVPLRAAYMEIQVSDGLPTNERTNTRTHFTPAEYTFINRYLRTMPKVP